MLVRRIIFGRSVKSADPTTNWERAAQRVGAILPHNSSLHSAIGHWALIIREVGRARRVVAVP
jgi:hypothetical protein